MFSFGMTGLLDQKSSKKIPFLLGARFFVVHLPKATGFFHPVSFSSGTSFMCSLQNQLLGDVSSSPPQKGTSAKKGFTSRIVTPVMEKKEKCIFRERVGRHIGTLRTIHPYHKHCKTHSTNRMLKRWVLCPSASVIAVKSRRTTTTANTRAGVASLTKKKRM